MVDPCLPKLSGSAIFWLLHRLLESSLLLWRLERRESLKDGQQQELAIVQIGHDFSTNGPGSPGTTTRHERPPLRCDVTNLSASSAPMFSVVVSNRMAASCMGSTRTPVSSWSRLAMRSRRLSVRGAMGTSRLSLQAGSVARPPPGGTRKRAWTSAASCAAPGYPPVGETVRLLWARSPLAIFSVSSFRL